MRIRSLNLILFAFVSSCAASVSVLNTAEPLSEDCNVQIFTSLDLAKEKGEMEELCVITGTSSGSFHHTVATAIEKHKYRACECGADKAYIQTQDAGTLGTASVTLVAFRYVADDFTKKNIDQKKDNSELIRKAKSCQKKGGVWVNDHCVIDID